MESSSLFCSLEMTHIGHSGFSSSRLGAKLVGWGRQLDAASQSTHPIANTTLEVDVQMISRQLYAILVVKRDGQALGIVQLVGKGEGRGSLASVEVGIQRACLGTDRQRCCGNSQPKSRLGG